MNKLTELWWGHRWIDWLGGSYYTAFTNSSHSWISCCC